MTLRTVVFARNTTHAGVSALIGARCYPLLIPENAVYPLVIYRRVSANNAIYRTQDNAVDGQTSREVSRVQMDAYAQTFTDSAELADQLRAAWDGYKDGCTVGSAWQANRTATYETGEKEYRTIVDVMIDHEAP